MRASTAPCRGKRIIALAGRDQSKQKQMFFASVLSRRSAHACLQVKCICVCRVCAYTRACAPTDVLSHIHLCAQMCLCACATLASACISGGRSRTCILRRARACPCSCVYVCRVPALRTFRRVHAGRRTRVCALTCVHVRTGGRVCAWAFARVRMRVTFVALVLRAHMTAHENWHVLCARTHTHLCTHRDVCGRTHTQVGVYASRPRTGESVLLLCLR